MAIKEVEAGGRQKMLPSTAYNVNKAKHFQVYKVEDALKDLTKKGKIRAPYIFK